MLPASLHSGFLCCTQLNRMFLPTTDPTDEQKISAQDCWVQRQMEEAMRHLPTELEVLPSPLLLEQMEREAVRLRSPPGCTPRSGSEADVLLPLHETSARSAFLCFRRRGVSHCRCCDVWSGGFPAG
ncbi:hypothetical protein ATANTOWER_030568 [Ataeniobius toweri]|uniref:Uncharacterized protein n=1 Tax=Ataeniobius toweri TaxID=208326 RepID=A0ABU7CM79_9TELE|nr:hypothetical protein [Ataeniobius toweri]